MIKYCVAYQPRDVNAARGEIGWMLQLEEKLDLLAAGRSSALPKFQKFNEADNSKLAIVRMVAEWPALPGAQRAKLVPGEILDKPPLKLHALDLVVCSPIRKFRAICHIGRQRKLRIMSANQYAVARRDQIGFDRVRPHLDGQLKRRQRVLRPIPASAAMGDD